MELRLGLSLLTLITYFSSTLSKNIRDGPNLRQRHFKRATPSEFLQPPAPSNNFLKHLPATNLAPPLPPSSPSTFYPIRSGRFMNNPRPENESSRGYFSRLLEWLNPWSATGGLEPPSQSFDKSPGHPSGEQRSVVQNIHFQSERNCNPCNDVPWVPIRSFNEGLQSHQSQNLKLEDGYYVPSPSQEVREPDFAYPPLDTIYPGQEISKHPIPNPHLYPGAMPPLYRAKPFSATENNLFPGSQNIHEPDFQHRKESSNFNPSLDSGGASTNIQESIQDQIQIRDSQGQEIHIHSNQGQGIHDQRNPGLCETRTQENQGYGNQNQGIQQQQGSQYQCQNQGIQIQVEESQKKRNQVQRNQGQEIQDQEILDQGSQIRENQGHWILAQEIQGQKTQDQESQEQRILAQEIQGEKNQTRENQEQDFQFQGNQGQIQENRGEGQQSQNQQYNFQQEFVPSIGGKVSSEQIHYEKSPVIDLSVSSTPSTPVVLTETFSTSSILGRIEEVTVRPSSLIDYLVSDYNDRIPISGTTDAATVGATSLVEATLATTTNSQNQSQESHEGRGYNEKQAFLEALMESYHNFQKEEASEILRNSNVSDANSGSVEISGVDDLMLATPSSRAAKKNKQVQIIIPYTSQYTPRPFYQSFIDDRNGREMDQHVPRKVPSGVQFDHFDDNVVGQESQTVPVTSFPDILSSSARPAVEKRKNNSIDVQRLQKNIDNWTIQEYSRGALASTVLPNATRSYLYPAKKIPNEYFTTMEPNNASDEIYDEEVKQVSPEFDFEDYKQMTTFEISRVTPKQESIEEIKITTTPKIQLSSQNPQKFLNQVETKENETESFAGTNKSQKENESELWKVHQVFPNTTTGKQDEKVFVVTPIPFGQKEAKKAVDVEIKKKPKKKEPEKIEKAYQVLPQAVNNLAVASTGPESVPLWGIMEHEEFASSNSDSESQLPILYAGHSRVSHAKR